MPKTPAAIVTKHARFFQPTLYRVTMLATADVRGFSTAQDAADWMEIHLPGAEIEWRIA